MTLTRRWTAQCDAGDCTASVIFEPIQFGERADYGMALNDAGWDATPGRDTTYCPKHWTIAARTEASRQDPHITDNFAARVINQALHAGAPAHLSDR